MKKYRVNLNRTVMDNCNVVVEANDEQEAMDKAIDISPAEVEEI